MLEKIVDGAVIMMTSDEEEAFLAQQEIDVAAAGAVPQSISDRQFFQQLAVNGIITEDQALASNAAVIPPPLLAIIDQMPAEQRFGVKMLVSGATTFERNNGVTIAIGEAYGMSPDDIDEFFSAAAQL